MTRRTALVTGAGSGIGALAAQRLAAAAWDVVAIDVDEAGLARTARRSPNVHVRVCDVTDAAAVDKIAAEAGPAQRVVHAAAISPLAPAMDQPLEEVERVLRTNLLGTLHVVRATLPAMLAAGRGELILFSSLAAIAPGRMTSAYAAAKGGINAYAGSLAVEYGGRGVAIRCVCPAQVDTPAYRRQAAEHPAATGNARGMHAGVVLDAVDRSLARDELFVFPGPTARFASVASRHLPRTFRWIQDRYTAPAD
ncbi:SDR family NAD(P)-dependent oxidoreductase [Actinomadura macrotermitis]|uniref:Ketoreductase domain-containing protein n=1 Tax=Actinomadura macrotermitis TaxID=2585200 RepID=A0A7K0C1C4_9ACTN|nr:SDR family NAD(P)-dependent oxidoreductase [Actinomadura macrotermitis]MQY07200.1 hypothetical protein [Actinomadura macrotermitis]